MESECIAPTNKLKPLSQEREYWLAIESGYGRGPEVAAEEPCSGTLSPKEGGTPYLQ
jgi:hypothetical protein